MVKEKLFVPRKYHWVKHVCCQLSIMCFFSGVLLNLIKINHIINSLLQCALCQNEARQMPVGQIEAHLPPQTQSAVFVYPAPQSASAPSQMPPAPVGYRQSPPSNVERYVPPMTAAGLERALRDNPNRRPIVAQQKVVPQPQPATHISEAAAGPLGPLAPIQSITWDDVIVAKPNPVSVKVSRPSQVIQLLVPVSIFIDDKWPAKRVPSSASPSTTPTRLQSSRTNQNARGPNRRGNNNNNNNISNIWYAIYTYNVIRIRRYSMALVIEWMLTEMAIFIVRRVAGCTLIRILTSVWYIIICQIGVFNRIYIPILQLCAVETPDRCCSVWLSQNRMACHQCSGRAGLRSHSFEWHAICMAHRG